MSLMTTFLHRQPHIKVCRSNGIWQKLRCTWCNNAGERQYKYSLGFGSWYKTKLKLKCAGCNPNGFHQGYRMSPYAEKALLLYDLSGNDINVLGLADWERGSE